MLTSAPARSERPALHAGLRALHLIVTMSVFPLAMVSVGDLHNRHGSSLELVQVIGLIMGGGMLGLGLVMADQIAYPPSLVASVAFTVPMVVNACSAGSLFDGGYAVAYAALGSQASALAYAIVTRWSAPSVDWFSRIFLTLTVLCDGVCLYWFRGPYLDRLDTQPSLALRASVAAFALQVVSGGVILSRRLFGDWSLGRWARPSLFAAGLSMMAGWIVYAFSQT